MTSPKVCPTCGNAYGVDSLFCPLDRTPLVQPGDDVPLQGTVVAERYLLAELIGSGGMGDVYRAQDVRLQRPAAVKLLRATLSADLDALRRFSREGMNASRINSPHVVQVYDAGETPAGIPYLAMEFVPGKSLGRLLADEGPLGPGRAAELVRQIAAGLDAAHRLGVVHRDLKPDNILIAGAGTAEETAKVVDFGISRALRDESQKVTKTGFVAGTYEFMSPEQVLGGELDQRSDLYALGLIAFMLLTGKLPFPGATAEHSMLMRLNESPRSLREMCPERDWPTALQAVFDRELSREPGQRFSTAGEFAAAYGRALLPPARSARSEVPPRSWRRWLAASIVGVALLAAGVVFGLGRGKHGVATRGISDRQDSVESGQLLPPADRAPETNRPSPSARLDDTLRHVPAPKPPEPTGRSDSSRGHRPPKPPAPPPPQPNSPQPAPAPAPVPKPREDGRALLDPFASILLGDLTPDSARLALAALDSLLPRLGTQRDSVDAALYRAEAYARMGEDERACSVLDEAWPRASEVQRNKIRLWVDRGLCPHSEWRRT